MYQIVKVFGHKNIKSTHDTTIEITTENFVTPTGDCIIGISANKGLADLRDDIKEKIRSGAKMRIRFNAGGVIEEVKGKGHKKLDLTSNECMIIRKSDFTCPRTLMIKADKAAKDLSRDMIELLKMGQDMEVRIIID